MRDSLKKAIKATTVTFTPEELKDVDSRLGSLEKVSRHEFMRWAIRVALVKVASEDPQSIYKELDTFWRMPENERFKV